MQLVTNFTMAMLLIKVFFCIVSFSTLLINNMFTLVLHHPHIKYFLRPPHISISLASIDEGFEHKVSSTAIVCHVPYFV